MNFPKARIAPPVFAFSALKLNLYTWQIETLAGVGKGMPTACLLPTVPAKAPPFLTELILWFLSEFPTGRAIVTSGSWAQLKSQLFDSLKRFQHHPLFRGWDFQESAIKTPQGGFAIGLSVDDAYKMEGHHRRNDSPVLIAIDEAKAMVADLDRLWLVGALLTIGDALSTQSYFDHAPEPELLRHLRNGVAHGNTFRINLRHLAKFPAHNRLAWVRSDSKAEFEITPKLQNQPVQFDFMGSGDIIHLLMSVGLYLIRMGNGDALRPQRPNVSSSSAMPITALCHTCGRWPAART
jgi:hypothetical protein